jgi:hypothetical protein
VRSRAQERIEHHACHEHVAEQLRLAGGENRFGEPNFRCVWGYDRIVSIHGEWQEWEHGVAKLTDKLTGYTESRRFTKLVRSVIETRQVPKYLPGNCWHLEMWRPPEEYGTPDTWSAAGQEVYGLQTIDTAGPFPARGEYELCYPLTHDGTSSGDPVPLVGEIVSSIVAMIVAGRERFTLQQRKAAIEQEARRKENGFVRVTEERLRDGLRPHAGETSVTVL